MEQPIILCGLGRVGWRVLEYLRAAALPVVVVDASCHEGDPRLQGVRLVHGDFRRREVLEQAGVPQAGGVLIVTSDDLVNISTALMVRHLHPGVRIVLRMFNQNLITRLGKAVNNTFALSTSTLVAPILAMTALTGQGLGTFRIEGSSPAEESPPPGRSRFRLPRLRGGDNRAQDPGSRRQVAEVTVLPGSPLRGLPLATVASRDEALVLAHFPAGGAARFLTEVDPAAHLQTGDRVVFCGQPRRLAPLLGLEDGEARLPWASWLRRQGRALWRMVAEVDLPVRVCLGVLLGVILVSTLVFHFSQGRPGLANALYRTIDIIATSGDIGLDETAPAGLKVYASALRLLGDLLLAAFTAIATNYLLRARLGGALEMSRIPERGHVIVCGLGNIGFRAVEELRSYGERVVVLEASGDSRFVTTARRLGVAVLHGDATVREVLRQANAGSARAVIAATSNDLVNLEVALLVRELNPNQRVVLRLSDPHLAQTLREAADVRLALSVASLAAPAFVAALFGDRVLNVLLVGDRLLAVVDLLLQPQDTPLLGQTVRALAVDYHLLPAAVLRPDGTMETSPWSARLEVGSRLVAIMSLHDLERFVRRQPVAADCAVDVTGFSLPAREWVALLLRTQQGLSAEEAERALEQLPVCLGTNLTRGQAEDLLALLSRERVSGQLRQVRVS